MVGAIIDTVFQEVGRGGACARRGQPRNAARVVMAAKSHFNILYTVAVLGYWSKGGQKLARGARAKILLINIHYSLKSIDFTV